MNTPKLAAAAATILTAATITMSTAAADPADLVSTTHGTGITATVPSLVENGYNVCWQLWDSGYTTQEAAAALQSTYPTLTANQAASFVTDAYQKLCPTPGTYDWWAYSTS